MNYDTLFIYLSISNISFKIEKNIQHLISSEHKSLHCQ